MSAQRKPWKVEAKSYLPGSEWVRRADYEYRTQDRANAVASNRRINEPQYLWRVVYDDKVSQ